ncbi:YfcE family phosphodiesterase [Clostridium botulinum]|uniref:metallophosphoesterase family protein n=1 Tax=Clostridium TaxID=1485 RepID=UPI0013F98927|nr:MULTISPECIES: YfcE family phosphodiesterase [Clostridium]MCS6131033.1 YfcE family phosphodiesterase [Clostridium botulinum]NFL43797.1 YfcE family phosphodiesterase [Clostridium botulinum]NFL88768.1 YfcE family phosphodiesterase [Clostridium botulinum]
MRVAVFSDVHGNIYSFKNILNSMKKSGIEQYIFCGDICGYYYHQNEIIELFKGLKNFICVMGNHDKKIITLLEQKESIIKKDIAEYGSSYSLLLKNITNENKEYLQNLSIKYEGIIDNRKIGVFHGSPFNFLEEYVYPTDSLNNFKKLEYDIVFLGHTHYSMYKKLHNVIVVNPGSCGQPRDGKLPSYAIWETTTNEVEIKYVEYNPTELVNDINRYDKSNKYLIDILYRGR